MPWRQASHSEKRGRAAADKAYDEQQRKTDAGLAFARKVHSSARWQHLRLVVLRKHPLCADPFGHHTEDEALVLADQVDHILGVTVRPDLAYVEENLQPLCTICHSKKSSIERGGKVPRLGYER